MNIFQVKTKPHGIERVDEFVSDEFIAIGWPGIGDLTNVDRDEIRDRLEQVYRYSGQQLGTYVGVINAFVNTMSEYDVVMFTRGDWVYIGEVGPYEYHPEFDTNDEGMCHQRPFKLKKVIEKHKMNSMVQELLRHRGTVTQFKHPYEMAELDALLLGNDSNDAITEIQVDVFEKAIHILTQALDSMDENIRVTAARALLQYKSR